MPVSAPQILILASLGGPGPGPGPGHWTAQWPQLHGHMLVPQHDWQRPLRGDWLMGLEEAVLARSGPLLLAADGLACLLVAAWAARSRHAQRVVGALLVQPLDVAREPWRTRLPSWLPVVLQRLPFASTVLAATDASAAAAAAGWAQAWGASYLNTTEPMAEPGWPQGQALLREFIKD